MVSREGSRLQFNFVGVDSDMQAVTTTVASAFLPTSEINGVDVTKYPLLSKKQHIPSGFMLEFTETNLEQFLRPEVGGIQVARVYYTNGVYRINYASEKFDKRILQTQNFGRLMVAERLLTRRN